MHYTKAEKVTRVGSVYYTVSVERRGSVGVTKWKDGHTWPIIADVTEDFVTLNDGICLPMPREDWVEKAVNRWHEVRKSLSSK